MFRINTDLASLTQDDGYMGGTLISFLKLARQQKTRTDGEQFCEDFDGDDRDNLEER